MAPEDYKTSQGHPDMSALQTEVQARDRLYRKAVARYERAKANLAQAERALDKARRGLYDAEAEHMIATHREAYDAAQSKNNAALKAQVGAYEPTVPGMTNDEITILSQLIASIKRIALYGCLPEGEYLSEPTSEWFEEWADTLDGICLFRRSRDAEAATNDCIEAGYNDA